MPRGKDINIVEYFKSKLDVIINTINALFHRTSEIEGFFKRFDGDVRLRIVQLIIELFF